LNASTSQFHAKRYTVALSSRQKFSPQNLGVAQQFALEGLIPKRLDSRYEAGRRSGAWIKVKLTQQQEFVIGGYTSPSPVYQSVIP
jgi:ATP-dependent DNA ligase